MDGFPERLRLARRNCEFSQEALARVVGVSMMTVSRWERGEMLPEASSLERLAGALSVSLDWLMSGQTAEAAS